MQSSLSSHEPPDGARATHRLLSLHTAFGPQSLVHIWPRGGIGIGSPHVPVQQADPHAGTTQFPDVHSSPAAHRAPDLPSPTNTSLQASGGRRVSRADASHDAFSIAATHVPAADASNFVRCASTAAPGLGSAAWPKNATHAA